jgi:hypothetical protein
LLTSIEIVVDFLTLLVILTLPSGFKITVQPVLRGHHWGKENMAL